MQGKVPEGGCFAILPFKFKGAMAIGGPGNSRLLERYVEQRSQVAIQSKNPVLILEAYCFAWQVGIIPSDELLTQLFDWFSTYLEAGGHQSLDKVIGLTGITRRGKNPFLAAFLEARNDVLKLDMYRLISLGATISEAAFLVVTRFKSDTLNLTGEKLDIGEERLEWLYKHEWSKSFKKGDIKKEVISWKLNEKNEFLSRFPVEQLSPTSRLRKVLR